MSYAKTLTLLYSRLEPCLTELQRYNHEILSVSVFVDYGIKYVTILYK